MRLPAVFFLSFLAIVFAVGCRKPLTPNIDRNIAPETWITAAPQDSITTFDPTTGAPVAGKPATIACRFHLYWAGADRDGAVAGFYFAVVETLPQRPIGAERPPPLPGPKPQDYHFTRRTDSTFVFSVSEFSPDREHAFYIYAVDNQGKADASPAKVVFNALDNFPPIPVIPLVGGAVATGKIYRMVGGGVIESSTVVVNITDSLDIAHASVPPRDSVPLNSRVDLHWRGEIALAGTRVAGFQYKLTESRFINVADTVTSKSYPARTVPGGSQVFTLRAVDEAGGIGETNRRFYMNYAPDTWFSGPDTTAYPKPLTNPTWGERYIDVPNWRTLTAQSGLLSCDSLGLLPAERPVRKSFYEIFENKLYVHSENDTVRMNSWVLFHGGGTDKDSPYAVKVVRNDPAIPATRACGDTSVLVPSPGPNGSPIGFHIQAATYQDLFGVPSIPSQSGLLPIFDPSSPFRKTEIGAYQAMRLSGKVYAVLRAEDGNALQDRRISAMPLGKALADKVDRGSGTPDEVARRSLIMTFYVNKAPRLLIGTPGFVPSPGQTFLARQLNLVLKATDDDPYDPGNPPNTGGRSLTPILRWTVTIKGRAADGSGLVYTPLNPTQFTENYTINLPPELASTSDTVSVQLCDCAACELASGQGRCVNYDIPITVPPPSGQTAPESLEGPTRPGNSNAGKRRASP